MPDEHDRWTVRRYRNADKNAVWRVHDRSLRDSAMRYSPEYNRCLRHIPTDFLEREGGFLVVTDNATAANATIADDRLHARTNGVSRVLSAARSCEFIHSDDGVPTNVVAPR